MDVQIERFRRQIAYPGIGLLGQDRLAKSTVAILGLGALGSTIAERIARCGVGTLRLIDRDWVELDNLPRQSLYTLHDAEYQLPKSIAAANHLAAIDPNLQLKPNVCDLTHHNALELLQGADIIFDGTDNFETRFLINDACVKLGIPWVHAGIVGASGQAMLVDPGRTACFRCLVPEIPPIESMQTCDRAGVLGPAVGVVASWQALLGLKWLAETKSGERCEDEERCEGSDDSRRGFSRLTIFELWSGEVRNVILHRADDCPTCGRRQFEFLNGDRSSDTKVLCGKNAVQIRVPEDRCIDLSILSSRLRELGDVLVTPFLIRFSIDKYVITVFSDGRGIVHGTENPEEARKIYARWIGG
jgi:molybdopterin/thiamine biosynthesis adenylyltransferase